MIRQFFSDHKLKGLTVLAVLLCIAAYSIHFAQAHYLGQFNYGTQLYQTGCGGMGCHSGLVQNSKATSVTISSNATEFDVGKTYTFQIVVKNPNPLLIAAGCDIGVDPGALLDTLTSTPSQGLTYYPTLIDDSQDTTYLNELVHTYPQTFIGDSAVWQFKFTAPDTPGVFLIYAAGNAVNGDSAEDGVGSKMDTDQWNTTTFTVNVATPSSVSAATTTASDVHLYPNPSTGIFTLSSSNEYGLAEVKISNEAGKTVKTLNANLSDNTPLDLTSLTNGTYFLHIKTIDGQSFLRRVVIKR